MSFPFVKSRPNPKRKEERRVRDREILHGPAKTERRREIFERSGGRCEALRDAAYYGQQIGGKLVYLGITVKRCNAPITLEDFHWSHKAHGARKDDSMESGIASCAECHLVGVHNPKPCPKRPGRVMKIAEAMKYWKGTACFCGGVKPKEDSFCLPCKQKLSPQQRLDLEEQKNADWLQTVAQCELTILTKK